MSQGLVSVTNTAVTATATLIVGRNNSRNAVFIRNRTASAGAVYVSSQPNVAAATGFEIPAGATVGPIAAQEALYAVAATTASVDVIGTTLAPS